MLSKMFQRQMEKLLEHLAVSMPVDVRDTALAGCFFAAQVVQVARDGPHPVADVAQGRGVAQMAEHHRHQMGPGIDPFAVLVTAGFVGLISDFIPRNEMQ